MKSTKLIVEYDYDFDILAVISSIKDYKMAWAINKTLKINLCKTDDLCLDFVKEGRLMISNFIFETEYTTFRLLKNKSSEIARQNKNYLIPELKDYDYLIKISGESISLSARKIIDRLKELSLVEYIKEIDIQQLKSKENLIF